MSRGIALLCQLFLSVSLLGQTRSDIESKYTSLGPDTYRVKPGIVIEVKFFENGKASSLKIRPDDRSDSSRLDIDEVRSVIRELVPGLVCFHPRNSSTVKMACPPKNDCRGVEEKWKRGTTLMVTDKKRGVVFNLITLNETAEPPPGAIKLLPGYEHVPSCGIDTLGGSIRKAGGLEINYDIGAMAGNFAYRAAQNAEWFRTEKVYDDTVLIVLTKNGRLVATYEKAVANFVATVRSEADIDDFVKMVITYIPRPSGK